MVGPFQGSLNLSNHSERFQGFRTTPSPLNDRPIIRKQGKVTTKKRALMVGPSHQKRTILMVRRTISSGPFQCCYGPTILKWSNHFGGSNDPAVLAPQWSDHLGLKWSGRSSAPNGRTILNIIHLCACSDFEVCIRDDDEERLSQSYATVLRHHEPIRNGTAERKRKGKFSNANDAAAEIIKRHAQRKRCRNDTHPLKSNRGNRSRKRAQNKSNRGLDWAEGHIQ